MSHLPGYLPYAFEEIHDHSDVSSGYLSSIWEFYYKSQRLNSCTLGQQFEIFVMCSVSTVIASERASPANLTSNRLLVDTLSYLSQLLDRLSINRLLIMLSMG